MRELADGVSTQGFAALCTAEGVVLASWGRDLAPGTPLASTVARDSRPRVLKLLLDARETPKNTVLEMPGGEALQVHCASDGEKTLVLCGATLEDLRRRCTLLASDENAGPLARSLAPLLAPDALSVSLWNELSRLNNELATVQRQLAKSNARLQWLNEQKNEFLGMAAHDLRNPLAAVLAYTSFVAEDAERLSGEQRYMLARIRVNLETMLAMIEDVVDFSAIESGVVRLEPSRFGVRDLVDEIAEAQAPIAVRKDVRIATAVHPDTGALHADRRKLAQVLNNLVTNAIKFSHPGSPVSISADAHPDGGVRISVSDHGVGLSAEQVSKLFQPFVRVGAQPTRGEKGTGLGLAIARRLVDAHGGRIEVESTPGSGTTFTVVLPRDG